MTRPNAHEDTEYAPAGSAERWGTPGPDTGSAATHGPAAADTARINRVPDDAVSDAARGPRRRGAADPAGERAYQAGAQAPADTGAGSGEGADSGEGSAEGRAGNWLLIALVALALIASVVMLLTDSSVALRLALLAALWAAVIGFFLVVRYRRAAETARKELEYTQNLREAEKARSAAEADAVRARGGAPAPAKEVNLREEDMQLLAEIRDSLAELRHQIEDLRGQAFEYEPAALRAQAWRLQELETRAQDSGLGPWGSAASAQSAETQHREKAGHVSGAPSVDAVAGHLGTEDGQSSGAPTISPELAELLREENDSLAANRATVRQAQRGSTAAQQSAAQQSAAQQAQAKSERKQAPKPAQKPEPQQADAATSTTSTSTRAAKPAQAAQQPKPDQAATQQSTPAQSAQPTQQPTQQADKPAATATTAPTVHTEPAAEAPKTRRGQHRAPEADTAATEATTQAQSQSARKDGKDVADAWRTETQSEETARGHHEAPAELRGRRRADERSGALTVAELLARRNK